MIERELHGHSSLFVTTDLKPMQMFLLQSLPLLIVLVETSHSLPPINFSGNVLTNRMIEALSEALVARERQKPSAEANKNRDQYQAASPYQQLFIDQYYQQQPPPAYEPQLSYYPTQTAEQQGNFYPPHLPEQYPQAPVNPQPSYPAPQPVFEPQYVPQPPVAPEQHVYPQHLPQPQAAASPGTVVVNTLSSDCWFPA